MPEPANARAGKCQSRALQRAQAGGGVRVRGGEAVLRHLLAGESAEAGPGESREPGIAIRRIWSWLRFWLRFYLPVLVLTPVLIR